MDDPAASDDKSQADFCRVCRCEGTKSKPLFYPCMCTGSIKYIHQECLVRWLEYSKRRTCELCNHRFKFAPIYATGTPRFIPIGVLLTGLASSLRRLALNWIHLAIVFVAWLIVVPLQAGRIYRCLFTGSAPSLLTLPLDMLSTRHLLHDCIQGFLIVILALAAFLGYVSLREQLLQGGGPAWLERDARAGNNNHNAGVADDADVGRHFFPDLFNMFGAPAPNEAAPDVFVEPNMGEAAADLHRQQPPQPSSSNNSDRSSLTSPSGDSSNSRSNPSSQLDDAGLPSQQQQLAWHTDEAADNQPNEGLGPGLGMEDEDDDEADLGGGAGDGADAGVGGAVGDAMNWEHLLGLDGSLSFLEHVLWLIALNSLFIIIFARIGWGSTLLMVLASTPLESLCTGLIGYLIFACALVIMHQIFALLDMPRPCYWTGLAYVYIKVALVSLLEMGIFPVLCGFWIDACTLSLFNATLIHRANVFNYAPAAFIFIHWAMGMLYIFYMASLLVLGRNVLRPGVLRFVYRFNDPDYKPIQDMILQPLPIYMQHLIATYSIWGILIVLMLWLPTEGIRRVFPGFLPFRITVAYDSPLDYSMEIILLQVVLPFLLDVQAKTSLRQLLRWWCCGVAWLLGLRSYLIGDVPIQPGDFVINENGQEIPYQVRNSPTSPDATTSEPETRTSSSSSQPTPEQYIATTSVTVGETATRSDSTNHNNQAETIPKVPSSAHAEATSSADVPPPPQPDEEIHVDMDDDEDHTRYVPYKRTPYFKFRIAGLLTILLASLMIMSLILITVPVGLGRLTLNLISPTSAPKHDAIALVVGFTILGLLLRLTSCIPIVFAGVWQTIVLVAGHSGNLMCWSRPLRVLRVWTRFGTTCEITIRRPALPAPMSALRSNYTAAAHLSRVHLGLYLRKFLVSLTNWLRISLLTVVLLGLLPTALGLLVNLIFIIPFRVGPRKTLVIGWWEHWIFGIMHLKVVVLLILVGPPWWLRNRLEIVQNEIVQHRLEARTLRLLGAAAPLLVGVGLSLALPYLIAYYVGPWLNLDSEFTFRYVYPGLFALIMVLASLVFQFHQLQRLYTHIKDERYLIGRQLVNFRSPQQSNQNSDSSALVPTTTVRYSSLEH